MQPMQTSRRTIAVALAVLALISALLTSCSGGEETDNSPLPDAATLLQQSSQATRDLKSVHLELRVTGSIPELPLESLSGDLVNAPVVGAQGKANIIFLGSKLEDVEFVVADGNLYAALTPGGKPDLIGPAADVYDVSKILNPDTGLANVLANFTNAKAEGRETINGVKTVKITGEVSKEAVDKIASEIGASGPVPSTAWIREDGNHELVRAKLDPSQGNSVEMTLSEWGKTVDIKKPA